MKCLVINLDRSVDRLAHVTAEFARIGIPFDRISAVDAANGSPVIAPPLTEAEVCCFLSHRACWQIIADGDEPYGAIFEDDVVFSHDAGLLLAGDTWIPKDADLVKIETFFVRVRLGRRQIALGNGHSLSRLVGWHAGTAGYIVSKTGAQRLLKRTRRLRAPIDSVIFNPSFIACASSTIYQLTPALCAQSQFVLGNEHHPTLIQHEVLQRRKDLLARISSHASRLFAHFRNGTLFANENVPSVAFGHRDGMSISIGDSPRIQMSAKARGRRS